MSKLSTAFSFGLITLGVLGYLLTGGASPTALIPAAFGIVALLLTWLSANPQRSLPPKLLIVWVVIGALGAASGVMKLGSLIDGSAERPAAIISQATMFFLSLTYLLARVATRRSASTQVESL